MRVTGAVLAALLLCGCGAVAVQPLKVDAPVAYAGLPPYDHCMTDKRVIVCPACFQPEVTPRFAVDPAAQGFLSWTCGKCGFSWNTKLAKDSKP